MAGLSPKNWGWFVSAGCGVPPKGTCQSPWDMLVWSQTLGRLGTVPGGAQPRCSAGVADGSKATQSELYGVSVRGWCVRACVRERATALPTGSMVSALQHTDHRGQCGPGSESWFQGTSQWAGGEVQGIRLFSEGPGEGHMCENPEERRGSVRALGVLVCFSDV